MHGPVIANLKTPGWFKYYDGGILKHDEQTNLLIEDKMNEFFQTESDNMML
jgi:hypothetical protein